MGIELGANIIYDPNGVARARERDLRVHIAALEAGFRIARADGMQNEIDIFYARSIEAKKTLGEFLTSVKHNTIDGS